MHNSIVNTICLILCGEMIAICCENHAEHIKYTVQQNAEFFILKLVVHIVTTVF
jgi:hypothetical protein